MKDGTRRIGAQCPTCYSRFLLFVGYDPIRCPSCDAPRRVDTNRKGGRRKSWHECAACGAKYSVVHERPIGE